jgi:hypothetical protein
MSNSPNKITLHVVVNGQPIEVEGNLNAPLLTVIQHALQKSGNSGQPPENWELRDGAGNILDGSRKLSEFNLTSGASVFLNLKAGVGG